MRILEDIKLDYANTLIIPKRSTLKSRADVSLHRTFKFKHYKGEYTGIPIIAANMDTVATFEMAIALAQHDVSTALHKHYKVDELVKFITDIATGAYMVHAPIFYSMGTSQEDFEKFQDVYKKVQDVCQYKITYVCIDVANGYSEGFVKFIERFRGSFPHVLLLAGNVVTPEMTEELILSGVDIVKVGIGPGSCCTTRKMTGIGYPQLSAVFETADAAHGLGGHICADGGCQVPGDVAKAFGGGADFVMLGGMLAGHDECKGEIISEWYKSTEVVRDNGTALGTLDKEKKFMKFYGMSSKTAMDKYNGGVAEYRASEGKEVLVPYRGPVDETIKQILGGVRSACTYTGSKCLKELSKRTTFIRVNETHNKIFGDE